MPMSWMFVPPAVNPALRLIAAQKVAEEAVAHELLDLSQPLVPIETEALKQTGRVVEHGGGYAVTYGTDEIVPQHKKSTNDYVEYVHERLDTHHPVGEAKFLEKPANSEHGKLREAAMAALRASL